VAPPCLLVPELRRSFGANVSLMVSPGRRLGCLQWPPGSKAAPDEQRRVATAPPPITDVRALTTARFFGHRRAPNATNEQSFVQRSHWLLCAAHAPARRAAAAVVRLSAAGLQSLRADDGDASVALVSSVLLGAGDPRITERRGRTRVAFEPHGRFRDRAKHPRASAFADMPAPSCPVLEAMRSPRLPSGMAQSGPKPVMARG
jgi:hypothetical protein